MSASSAMTELATRPRASLLSRWIAHRGFAWRMAVRELRTQYVGSSIGFMWAVVHPLMMIVIYSLVFSGIMGIQSPRAAAHASPFLYTIYLCCGLLPWFAFADGLSRGVNVSVGNAGLIKRIHFPCASLVVSACLVSLINLTISMLLFLVLLLVAGFGLPGWPLLGVPLLMLLQTLFLAGFVLFCASLNVFIRDVAQLVVLLSMIWFWVTPIVYEESAIHLPEGWLTTLFHANPFYHFAEMYRSILMDQSWFSPVSLLVVVGYTLAALVIAFRTFNRVEEDLLDNL